jgi:hypothetical protein
VIIISIDIYYYIVESKEISNMDNVMLDKNTVEFVDPNPWTKIYVGNNINKYYLKIKNINKYLDNIVAWKQLPFIRTDMIDVDVENEFLIIKSNNEREALVVSNLIISNLNNELTIDDIVAKDLINTSLAKADKYIIVVNKLREFIKEGLLTLNKEHFTEEIIKEDIERTPEEKLIDSIKPDKKQKKKKRENMDNISPVNNLSNDNLKEEIPMEYYMPQPMYNVMPYEGSEYATINF